MNAISLLRVPTLLTLIAVGVALAGSPAARAHQVDPSLPPLSNLSITVDDRSVESTSDEGDWTVILKNNAVQGHPAAAVGVVRVKIELLFPTTQPDSSRLNRIRIIPEAGTFDRSSDSTGVWIVQNVPAYGREALRVETGISLFGINHPAAPMAYGLRAEIIESTTVEPPGSQSDNVDTGWFMQNRGSVRVSHTNGDATVFVSVPRMHVFSVNPQVIRVTEDDAPGRNLNTILFDVQVEISLSPALAFASSPQAPSGTTLDLATGVWDVGTLIQHSSPTLEIPVRLTSDHIPLGERCLTAKVVRAVPAFQFDQEKRANDVSTVCLEDPKVVLTGGEIPLFYFYSCVGVTAYPCTDTDTLELVVRAVRKDIDQPRWTRVDDFDRDLNSTITYFRPGKTIVQVGGEAWTTDGNNSPLWSTAEKFDLTDSQTALPSSVWSDASEDFALTGLGGGQPPGPFTVDFEATGIQDVEIADTTKVVGTSFSTGFDAELDLEFGSLGTYVLAMDIKATHNTVGQLTDSDTYTFHVGPIAELEVRNAGASPYAIADQYAYAVMALNNGPDVAPAARVTLTKVPEGAEAVASEGDYSPGVCRNGLCEGVWFIGELTSDDRRASGHGNEGPTLTLVTDNPAAPDITATIENTRDYSVVINGTIHSTDYLDYLKENNTATIAARRGIGREHPEVPSGVRVIDTPTANIVAWQPVERVNGHEVTHYELQRSASPWSTLADGVEGTVYVDVAAAGQLRPYRVRAVNTFGIPGPWSMPTLTLPDAPGDFTAAQLSDGVVELAWTRPDGNGAEITGYDIEVSTDGGQSWTDAGASLGGGDTGWVHRDTSLGAGRLYRIRADSNRGPGPWAQAASAVVGAPVLSVLAQGPGEIWLSWTMPGGDEALVREYQLEHSTNGTSWSRLATVQAGGDMFYVHENLSPSATRYYRIRAGTERGHGPWSEVVSTATGPGAPGNFRAQANGPSEIALSWTEPSVRDAEVWEYELDQSADGGGTWERLAVVYPEQGTAYVHGGLDPGETRHYRVRALSYYGGAVIPGQWSPVRSATTDAGGPEAPKDLLAEADGDNAIKLSWTVPADNGSAITGYRIEHSPDGGATWQRLRDRHGSASYRHGGLLSGTTHFYRVAAINRNGRSEFSSVAWATTGGDETTVPGMPTGLRITSAERDRVSIAWGPPEDDGGSRVTGYEYLYFGPCANAPEDICDGGIRNTRGTSATVSGLKTAGVYDFVVWAVNAVGAGEWAGPVQAVVNPEVRGRVVVTPASLTVNEGGSATYRVRLSTSPAWPVQVALFWDDEDNVLADSLAGHQGMILLPGDWPEPTEGDMWYQWAYRWNVGVPITVEAVEDGDAEDGAALIHHEVFAVPCDWLGNPEGCAPDPVYDGMIGPSVKVTVRDND